MNILPTLCRRHAAAAVLVIVSSPLAFADDASRSDRASLPSKDEPVAAPSSASRHAQSARVLIGQDVHDTAGDTLGEVHDLVVDPEQGKIHFALVASGGLLGVGEEIRAVPFSVFRRAADGSRDLVLDIPRDRWSQAPALAPEHIAALSDRNVTRDVLAFYNEALDEDVRAGTASLERSIRVTEIIGSEVDNAGRKVGTVEDVIVHFDSRRASVLLDTEDDYAGTDRKFLVNFAQLSPAGEDRVTTTLAPDDFSGAAPADDRWWTTLQGYPYWWGGYGGFGGAAYSVATGELPTDAAIVSGEREGRRSVEVVRGRLRSDPELSDKARLVTVEEQNDRLVLNGTVDSQASKNAVHRLVADYAAGWEIVDRIEVSAAE